MPSDEHNNGDATSKEEHNEINLSLKEIHKKMMNKFACGGYDEPSNEEEANEYMEKHKYKKKVRNDNEKIQKYNESERIEQQINRNERYKKISEKLDFIAYNREIIIEHWNLLDVINPYQTSFNLWQDGNDFFYKEKLERKIKKGDKNKISKLISIDLQDDVLIVDNITEIEKIKNKKHAFGYFPRYLLSYKIAKIYEGFNPFNSLEFYRTYDKTWSRNTFEYTSYLKQREVQKDMSDNSPRVIIDLIKSMTNSEDEYIYILNWLAYFFQNLRKSNIALTLIGDKEVSEDIIYNEIIQPIFGSKFCITIDDETIKKEPIEEIINEKIFYHLPTLLNSTKKLKKTKKIIRNILIKNKVEATQISKSQTEDLYIYGQTLITSDSIDNSLISDVKSRCSVIKISSMKSIIKKFRYEDSISLYADIENDLSNFANTLATYKVDDYMATNALKINEKQEEILNIDNKIENFINAIKNHHAKTDYFKKIEEESPDLYEELIYNFEENMIARPSLYIYFNIIYGDTLFSDNKKILDILKEKDGFFKQNIDKNTQYNRKKRYDLSKV